MKNTLREPGGAGGASAAAVAAVLIAATASVTGCARPDPVRQSAEAESRLETLVVEIDEQSEAHAIRISDTQVRVSIERSDGTTRLTADFRATGGGNGLVEYQLYPLVENENMSHQPVSAVLDLDLERVPTLEEAVTGAVFIHTQASHAVSGEYDDWGCDVLPGRFNYIVSCGPKGACCDRHDDCYAQHHCTASSWLAPPWNACQRHCNGPAVRCFLTESPGPSTCCAMGNCGTPRR